MAMLEGSCSYLRSRHEAFVHLEVEATKILDVNVSTSESLRGTKPSWLVTDRSLRDSPTIRVPFSL